MNKEQLDKFPATTLTQQELYVAAIVGVRRRIASLSEDGWHELHGLDQHNQPMAWWFNMLGAMAECAWGKIQHLYWPMSVNAKKSEPDIPPIHEVRCSEFPRPSLIVRQKDCDDYHFHLVYAALPTFYYLGWASGKEAKVPEFLECTINRPPAWFVPQAKLHSPSLKSI